MVGTPAITTRGLIEDDMKIIVEFIDEVISNHSNESVLKSIAKRVNSMMGGIDPCLLNLSLSFQNLWHCMLLSLQELFFDFLICQCLIHL